MGVYKIGSVQLVKAPASTKELLELRKKLALEVPIGQLKEMVQHLPCTVIDKISDKQYIQLLMTTGLQGYLLFLAERQVDTGFGAWCAYKGAAEQRKKQADQPDGSPAPIKPKIINVSELKYLAELLSNHDPWVMHELDFADGRAAPKFFHEHKQQFAERGIETMSDLSPNSNSAIWLLGLVDILIRAGYACELDWKCELENFVWAISRLFAPLTMNLPVKTVKYNPEDDMEGWAAQINKAWQPLHFVLLHIDINSDSYVFVPCPLSSLPEVLEAADSCDFNFLKY